MIPFVNLANPLPTTPGTGLTEGQEAALTTATRRQPVASIAALKALTPSAGDAVTVLGYYAAGDGGGGLFRYDGASSATDNGGTIIAPTAGSGRWLRIYSGAVNVRWFGAKGDGIADDSSAIQAAVDACSGDDITFGDGLTYLISAPILIGSGNSTADPASMFGKSSIVFYYEQNPALTSGYANPGKKQSGFHCMATPNTGASIEIRGLTLSYLGTFNYGTYEGLVNGLLLYGYDRILIDGVSASGFNAAGIYIGGAGFGYTSINTKQIIVTRSRCSGNRISGVEIGYTQEVIIDGCVLDSNGMTGDNSTGYGFAAQSGTENRNVTVRNCTANNNFRKGIDFHTATEVLVSGNQCDGNALYGIYVARTTNGNASIVDNRITGMATAGITTGYGIFVGQDEDSPSPLRAKVSGNFIEGTQSGGGNFYPIVLRNGGNNEFIVVGNIAYCGIVTNFVFSDDAGSAGLCSALINDNIFRADDVSQYYAQVYEKNLLDFSFCGNVIEDRSASYGHAMIVKFNAGTPPVSAAQCLRIVRGNSVRVTAASSVTRFFDSDVRVIEEQNYLRGVRHVPEPTYTIAAGVITIGDVPSIKVDTEATAATDDLNTITAGYSCQRVLVRAASSSRDVVLKDGTGNLSLVSDMTLTHGTDTIELVYNKSNAVWQEISRSDNTA